MYQTKNLGLNITEINKDKLQPFNFDTDLGDNFKAIDEKTLSHRNITNCLLEVPQDIKLEIVDGVITLKEGSKVYVPNGFETDGTTKKFDKVEITVDKSNSTKGSGDILLAIGIGGNLLALEAKSFTVTERPESTVGTPLYYNITTNKAEYYDNSVWNSNNSFPIAIVERTDNGFTNIKQVFNGFGYIGSTVFALPGAKGLVPNGRNEDFTFKNLQNSSNGVFTYTFNSQLSGSYITSFVDDSSEGFTTLEIRNKTFYIQDEKPSNINVWWYQPKTNQWKFIESDGTVTNRWWLDFGVCSVTSGKITSFTPKKPFRAVDHNDYQTKITELETKIATLEAAVKALQGS